MYPDLLKAAKQGKGAAVKVAAADALAICCFVAAEDEHTTLEVMDQLQSLWNKGEGSGYSSPCVGLWLAYQTWGVQDEASFSSTSSSASLIRDNCCHCIYW